MFFNKKKENIFAPVGGQLIKLENVNDPVFSSKAMGEGFGIEPDEANIYSPISGKVISVFPTKHAILLETKNQKGGAPPLNHFQKQSLPC